MYITNIEQFTDDELRDKQAELEKEMKSFTEPNGLKPPEFWVATANRITVRQQLSRREKRRNGA